MDLEVPKIQTGFFAVRADFAPFALTNDDKKRRYVNDTFDANSMAQTRCYVNDTVNGVGQSIRHAGPVFFRDQLYQGQQSGISVSKELGDGITKTSLFVGSRLRQNFLFSAPERSFWTNQENFLIGRHLCAR